VARRKKREEEWTKEDWDEWYEQQIKKLARSLKLEIKTILKKMEWDDDPAGGAEQIMEDLSEKVLNEFYP
jgi:hypothetical protein